MFRSHLASHFGWAASLRLAPFASTVRGIPLRRSAGAERCLERRKLGVCGSVSLGLAVLALSASGTASAVDLDATFDLDAEGWTWADFTPYTHLQNPPPTYAPQWSNGALRYQDSQAVYWGWYQAPASWLGDRSAAYGESLSFDLLVNVSDGAFARYPEVALVGATHTLYYPMYSPPVGTWTHLDIPLSPGVWTVDDYRAGAAVATQADLEAVLADLQGLYLFPEWSSSQSDDDLLDNVHLPIPVGVEVQVTGGCPGPATVTVHEATPGGSVAVAYATSAGQATVPANLTCGGTVLGLAAPVQGYLLTTANAAGDATRVIQVPQAMCGNAYRVQAVDLTTCATSDVVQVP